VVAIFRGNKMEEECSHKGLKVEIRVGAWSIVLTSGRKILVFKTSPTPVTDGTLVNPGVTSRLRYWEREQAIKPTIRCRWTLTEIKHGIKFDNTEALENFHIYNPCIITEARVNHTYNFNHE
jgi:hypothetical protein